MLVNTQTAYSAYQLSFINDVAATAVISEPYGGYGCL